MFAIAFKDETGEICYGISIPGTDDIVRADNGEFVLFKDIEYLFGATISCEDVKKLAERRA